MESLSSPRIVAADRLNGGIIIAFDDGKCAIFSASLLYAVLPQAQEVNEPELQE